MLTHGTGATTLAAAAGTAMALAVVAALSALFTGLADISGYGDESSRYLSVDLGISLPALLLASSVIGALGVLDDATVSQASTVNALRRVNPSLTARQLFSTAMDVGRSHVAATINTLVLTYVGAALPLLLLIYAGGAGVGGTLNAEPVAQEVVITVAGSVGLMAAIPLTTAIACLLAVRLPQRMLEQEQAEGCAHAH